MKQINNPAALAFHLADVSDALCRVADAVGDRTLEEELFQIADRLGVIADKLEAELEAIMLLDEDARADGRLH